MPEPFGLTSLHGHTGHSIDTLLSIGPSLSGGRSLARPVTGRCLMQSRAVRCTWSMTALLIGLPSLGGAQGSWLPTNLQGAPTGRFGHSAVWTGSRVLIWGGWNGDSGSVETNTGAVYDPGVAAWSATNTSGAPLGRQDHSTVWTGSRMIVWGGCDGGANSEHRRPLQPGDGHLDGHGTLGRRRGRVAAHRGLDGVEDDRLGRRIRSPAFESEHGRRSTIPRRTRGRRTSTAGAPSAAATTPRCGRGRR